MILQGSVETTQYGTLIWAEGLHHQVLRTLQEEKIGSVGLFQGFLSSKLADIHRISSLLLGVSVSDI